MRSLPQVTIGYISTIPEELKLNQVLPTFDSLKQTLGHKYDLKLVAISSANLEAELQHVKPQFLIAPIETYLLLSTSPKFGAHDIATLKSLYVPTSGGDSGSVFITKADRSDLNEIKDMKGKSVVAQSPDSLVGWWSALGEIERHGFSSDNFFRRKSFVYTSPMDIIEAVLSNSAEIGILPTCYLESVEGQGLLSKDAVKVVSLYKPKEGDATIYCRRSTKNLYPGLVFGAMAKTPDATVKDVTRAVFAMPAFLDQEWSTANDFIGAMNLMRELRFGMFEHLRDYSLKGILKRYTEEIIVVTLLLLFLLFNEIRVHRLVRKRTHQLVRALEAKERAEKEALTGRKRLTHIERSGVISQMSNIIAHELKQPLGSLLNYSAVLKMRLSDQLGRDPLLNTVVENLNSETRRIANIVDSVRKFARKEQSPQIPCNLIAILSKAVRTFNQQENADIRVPVVTQFEDAPIKADPLSLELLLLNLIRNAATASLGASHPEIGITVESSDKRWIVTVWNNGKVLNDEIFQKLEHAAESTKAEGLGLGLAIVREIVDMHGAEIHFSRREGGGISAVLIIDHYRNVSTNPHPSNDSIAPMRETNPDGDIHSKEERLRTDPKQQPN